MYWILAAVLVTVGMFARNRSWARIWRVGSVALVALLLIRGADAGRLNRHVQYTAEQDSSWTLEFRDGTAAMRNMLSQSNWLSAPLLICLVFWAVTGAPGSGRKEKVTRSPHVGESEA